MKIGQQLQNELRAKRQVQLAIKVTQKITITKITKTVIKDITGNSSDFFAFCTKTCLEKDLNLIKAGKGGRRVASYAQGFNLTLPGEFQPSDLQWKKIYFEVRDALKKASKFNK